MIITSKENIILLGYWIKKISKVSYWSLLPGLCLMLVLPIVVGLTGKSPNEIGQWYGEWNVYLAEWTFLINWRFGLALTVLGLVSFLVNWKYRPPFPIVLYEVRGAGCSVTTKTTRKDTRGLKTKNVLKTVIVADAEILITETHFQETNEYKVSSSYGFTIKFNALGDQDISLFEIIRDSENSNPSIALPVLKDFETMPLHDNANYSISVLFHNKYFKRVKRTWIVDEIKNGPAKSTELDHPYFKIEAAD